MIIATRLNIISRKQWIAIILLSIVTLVSFPVVKKILIIAKIVTAVLRQVKVLYMMI